MSAVPQTFHFLPPHLEAARGPRGALGDEGPCSSTGVKSTGEPSQRPAVHTEHQALDRSGTDGDNRQSGSGSDQGPESVRDSRGGRAGWGQEGEDTVPSMDSPRDAGPPCPEGLGAGKDKGGLCQKC